MITDGDFTPEICSQVEKAFNAFFVHKGIEEDKQVARVFSAFQDVHVEEWLSVNRDELLLLTFKEFMAALRKAHLPVGWENKLKTSILFMRQGDQPFINWYHLMAGRNILLRNTSYHLSQSQNLRSGTNLTPT